MTTSLEDLAVYLRESRGAAVSDAAIAYGELTLTTQLESYVELLTFLRDDERCKFVSFIDLCGVDWPAREKRFDVVVHLLSPKQNMRIRVKVAVAEDESVPSLTGLYMGAEWFEREAWDMYGIPFAGHSDLRRILTDYGFEGFPLRKDFPTTGLVEVRYDDSVKRVVYEPVELRQEFRNFDFLSPWEGTDYVLPGDEKAK
ncbi:NADH-quinone oxidoreductase subunit C [Rhizobium sp. KVB221]|uniref:NADH-quinone oxidoreductase subunit C n=1 Tax=Rhizobium setariae TaxID=2801340 RepID=A0A936YTN3_9HYPH|nr:NADH-quinone oxidoreductase subunit C [Rhizobium setariae]MBL0372826.1 NADH-quinone oxidoreductase subunit C [Rhizobium setariae]